MDTIINKFNLRDIISVCDLRTISTCTFRIHYNNSLYAITNIPEELYNYKVKRLGIFHENYKIIVDIELNT